MVNEEIDAMRRKLLRIKQLINTGNLPPDEEVDSARALLFNSVYIGLPPDAEDLEGDALLAAIDEQLENDADTASQGSWQTLDRLHIPSTITSSAPQEAKPSPRLARSKRPSIQFCLRGVGVEYDAYPPDTETASRLLATIHDVEILDHLRTSTWRKFLTQMREDQFGNMRETDSHMVRLEILNVRPVLGDSAEETRLTVRTS